MDSDGTVKLLDGLYLGDQTSARDEELILLNHITAIINCSTNIPNFYQHYQINYADINVIKDNKLQSADDWQSLVSFIEQAKAEGESVLIHSEDHLDHPATLAAIYIMKRFRWSLFKTLQYIYSRIHNLTFSYESFQLLKSEELKMLDEDTMLSYNWQMRPTDQEQLVLRNTYLNSTERSAKMCGRPNRPQKKTKNRVTWSIKEGTNKTQDTAQISQTNEAKSRLKLQILSNVRKIIRQANSQSTNTIKLKTQTLISTIQQGTEYQYPPLKKYKSTYALPSFHQESKRSDTMPSIQQTKTQNSHISSINKQNQAGLQLDYQRSSLNRCMKQTKTKKPTSYQGDTNGLKRSITNRLNERK